MKNVGFAQVCQNYTHYTVSAEAYYTYNMCVGPTNMAIASPEVLRQTSVLKAGGGGLQCGHHRIERLARNVEESISNERLQLTENMRVKNIFTRVCALQREYAHILHLTEQMRVLVNKTN
jgi:hypothetical protein